MKVMKNLKVFLLSVLFALATPISLLAENTPLINKTYQSTALLYKQSEDGGMHMTCTATAFEKVKPTKDIKNGYLFVTASHCVGEDDTQHERVQVVKTNFYITFDEAADKKFRPARLIAAGYQHRGDDFAIFEVDTDEIWPITPWEIML